MEITYTETAYGTKLMVIKEVEGQVNYVDFYSVYLGYEIEIVVVAQDENGLTDAQIQMVIDFLSELDFVEAENDAYPQPEGGKKFESDWAIVGGLAEIYYEEEGYRVTLTIDNQDGTGALWQYSCYYAEDTDSLLSVSSSRPTSPLTRIPAKQCTVTSPTKGSTKKARAPRSALTITTA